METRCQVLMTPQPILSRRSTMSRVVKETSNHVENWKMGADNVGQHPFATYLNYSWAQSRCRLTNRTCSCVIPSHRTPFWVAFNANPRLIFVSTFIASGPRTPSSRSDESASLLIAFCCADAVICLFPSGPLAVWLPSVIALWNTKPTRHVSGVLFQGYYQPSRSRN